MTTIKQEMRRITAATVTDEMKREADYIAKGYTPEQAAVLSHADTVFGPRTEDEIRQALPMRSSAQATPVRAP